jgi:hypothetical protein
MRLLLAHGRVRRLALSSLKFSDSCCKLCIREVIKIAVLALNLGAYLVRD